MTIEDKLVEFFLSCTLATYQGASVERKLWLWGKELLIYPLFLYAMAQLLIYTPDNFPIIIGLNPAYVESVTCAQSRPLIETAQNCSSLGGRLTITCGKPSAQFNYTGLILPNYSSVTGQG